MLFLKQLFFTFVIFFCLTLEPFAQSLYTYVLDYNEKPTAKWTDTQVGVSYYEIRLIGIKKTGEEVIFPSEQLLPEAREKQLIRPRSGDFKVQIRACNTTKCSEWADSTNPEYATVNDVPMGWILRWKVPKPSNITIGDLLNKLIIYLYGGNNYG
jgi:hypothetical protein